MRTQDYSPFARYSVGFDRIFDLLNNTSQISDGQGDYPPYNIVKTGEDRYSIALALAGFSPEEITITAQQNLLRVSGRKSDAAEGAEYLHRGIPARSFERQFGLADYIEVTTATYDNGLLQIELVREIPDVMKPRRINIATEPTQGKAGERLKVAS
jgi:molecular chaperone IbpA